MARSPQCFSKYACTRKQAYITLAHSQSVLLLLLLLVLVSAWALAEAVAGEGGPVLQKATSCHVGSGCLSATHSSASSNQQDLNV